MSRLNALAAALAIVAPVAAAFAAQQPRAGSPGARGDAVSLVGCLEAVRAEAGFRLTDARPASREADDSMTSPGAGASATGEAPSGSVSGRTPTGSTATETSAPTPATGTPDARANPASPDYNRGEGDVTAGTTGTVPRPEGGAAAAPRRYRVAGDASLDLAAHAGHVVRIDGLLEAESPPAGAGRQRPVRAREPLVTATSVRRVAGGCKP